MNMSKKLEKYKKHKDKSYWHQYHLKRDPDFQKEAKELDSKLAIELEDGRAHYPTTIEDFDYLKDSDKDKKIELIRTFQKRWHISWDYDLLQHLIRGLVDDVPPPRHGGIELHADIDQKVFDARLPLNATRMDLDVLWDLIRIERRHYGVKEPSGKYSLTETKTAIAYHMWKRHRDNASWTSIIEEAKQLYGIDFYDISTAQDFLRANGFWTGG
jgi:hypothetical protein